MRRLCLLTLSSTCEQQACPHRPEANGLTAEMGHVAATGIAGEWERGHIWVSHRIGSTTKDPKGLLPQDVRPEV